MWKVSTILMLAATSTVLTAMMAQSSVQTGEPDGKGLAARPDSLNLNETVWIPHPTPAARSYAGCRFIDPAKMPAMTTWGDAQFKRNRPGFGPNPVSSGSNDPILACFPPGVPRVYVQFVPFQFVQLRGEILELFEYDHFVRHIYTDGRSHPKEQELTWMGHSIGQFEGQTLVVDTVGMNDKTWIDRAGHPHSSSLHVIERISRPDRNTLLDDITIDDPKAYTAAFTGQMTFELQPKWELKEYICADNVDSNVQN